MLKAIRSVCYDSWVRIKMSTQVNILGTIDNRGKAKVESQKSEGQKSKVEGRRS